MTGTVVTRRLAVQGMDPAVAKLIKRTVLKPKDREATDLELALFAEQVHRTGLDPFLKQIYGIYRWDSRAKAEVMQVQVSIDGLRLTAERTGKYEGQTPVQWCGPDAQWTDVWLSDEPPAAARAGVFKAGHRAATYAVAAWREYKQTNSGGDLSPMWKRMGALMLGKCAEALALRKCFPAEMSGLHTPEEMAQADSTPPEVVDALPAAEDRPTDEQVLALVELAVTAVEVGAVTEQRLNMLLIDAGAGDTNTVQAAAQTMTADAVEELRNAIADLLAAAEEASGFNEGPQSPAEV